MSSFQVPSVPQLDSGHPASELVLTDFYDLDFRVCYTHLQVSVNASTKDPVLTKDGVQWHHQWCNPILILVIVPLERKRHSSSPCGSSVTRTCFKAFS